ncbi:N-formylglutamate amidohydrolase [Rhizobiaceae bacterium n13]|uniref:N-formylglutamate amidohydrolase n=1 Tax=Ferirhizobium litorale TaxID=2927786 RepID=A0AAE3QHV3_9HYPH|nr:N-formylglutamate amidohydrolase [Fererhizobium litorale]MDI7863742.1 N-formylglutamate amidohydrolase [Fererhizobium litorale]MDI7924158.1 N-formylglutamate amidohydrolase [Fererhizobium litorale]
MEPGILTTEEGNPVEVVNPGGRGDVLLVCEHASSTIPVHFGDLGLPIAALESHIAWDPGALAVSTLLSRTLDATLVYQRFSRLVYDCNRPPESPAAIPEFSEIYTVPGNAGLTQSQRDARTNGLYIPFHARIAAIIAERRAQGRRTVLVTIHSFTPVYNGHTRSVEIGILHDSDTRLADRLLAAASDTDAYRFGRNQPYGPADGVTHTLKLHALGNGLLNVMIEVRNDLISDETGQEVMADLLAGLLQEGLAESGI